jgi:hypothetical protein
MSSHVRATCSNRHATTVWAIALLAVRAVTTGEIDVVPRCGRRVAVLIRPSGNRCQSLARFNGQQAINLRSGSGSELRLRKERDHLVTVTASRMRK